MYQKSLNEINERIKTACLKTGRDSNSVQLLLATKTQSLEAINEVINLGYGLVGENRAQEVVQKNPFLLQKNTTITPRENHFIGHLQSNKIKSIFHLIDCFQSIDRLSLAEKLNDFAKTCEQKKSIFIQVNVSSEDSKSGVDPQNFFTLLEEIQALEYLSIKGLMTIGLNQTDELSVRKGYEMLYQLSEKARQKNLMPKDATALSMGMSRDLEWAILEGATMVRVGSSVFGERK